jgi:hypothetical protein
LIYATALPIEEYGVTVDGYRLGLYDTYMDRPMMLALICMITPLPFDYEGCREISNRRVQLPLKVEETLSETLSATIDGVTVAEHLKTLTPLEFNELIQSAEDLDLPAVDGILGGNLMAFKLIVSARATAWALNYRGKLPSQGKVVNVAFRGLTVSSEMLRSYEILKKEFTV